MNRIQKTGGFAALFIAALFITSFIFILIVWPVYGVRGPADVSNPAAILPAVAQAPILLIWLAINIPIAAALSLVVFALYRRMQLSSTRIARFALFVGLASALLFFAVGVLRITGYPRLASQYAVNPAEAASAYARYLVVDSALDRAAIFSSGLWLVLVNWAALKEDRQRRFLYYFGLAAGAAGIIGAILPSIAPVALLLYIVWFLWFGMTVLRNRAASSET